RGVDRLHLLHVVRRVHAQQLHQEVSDGGTQKQERVLPLQKLHLSSAASSALTSVSVLVPSAPAAASSSARPAIPMPRPSFPQPRPSLTLPKLSFATPRPSLALALSPRPGRVSSRRSVSVSAELCVSAFRRGVQPALIRSSACTVFLFLCIKACVF
ncbi:hypothetical protein M9458_008055, partial [Cirrhinus mrigala]